MKQITPHLFRWYAIRARQVLRAPLCFAIDLSVDLIDARCYTTPGGQSGFAIKPDGQLVNMHSFAKARGAYLTVMAIDRGAVWLNAYDGPAADVYRRLGFDVVERWPFDPALAPKGWITEYWGTPDVVEMRVMR